MFLGRILVNNILELIEPKTIKGKDRFKIQDTGNLSHFPIGSVVHFNLGTDSKNGNKLATIISKAEHKIEVTTKESETKFEESNVLKFTPKEKNVNSVYSKIKNPLHFYVVFNPMFNNDDREKEEGKTQAHSFYNLLKSKISNPDDSEKYLYWGKMQSSESNEKLSPEVFREVLKNNSEKNTTTHLYISDFNYLWVARVDDITFNLDQEKNENLTLEFYKKRWDKIEVWFKITDMVLISNNNTETTQLISKLVISPENTLNSRQDPKNTLPVTPYLSGLRYPLAIEDSSKAVHFEKPKTILLENVLLEKDSTVTMTTKKNIYSYVIPEFIFSLLSPIVQREILSAEIIFNNPQNSTNEELFNKDFSVAKHYLIALEKTLKDETARFNIFYADGSLNDLYKADISQFKKLEKENKDFYDFILSLKRQSYLWKFNKIRNDTVHLNDNIIDHQSLINIRRKILGIGDIGIINSLLIASRPQIKKNLSINLIQPVTDKMSA